MDARVRTGAAAYNQPGGAGYCPPGAGTSSATSSAAGGASGAGTGAGASGARPGGTSAASSTAYSSSFGNVGMSDFDAGSGAGAGGGSGATSATNGDGHSPAEAFKDVGARLGELKEFASYYVAAKLDAYKVTARNLGMYAALGIVGLIAGSAIISTAAVLLLVGLAIAIGKPFNPDQPWVGAIVVGLLVLGGLAGGIIFFMKRLTNTARAALVEKYKNRQRDQRIQFGEDVRGRRAGVRD
jgi:hypothetical protein